MVGTWLFPATLFSLFWFAFIFFPLIIMFEIPINPWAVGYLSLLVILFSWTFIFFNWKKAFNNNLNKPSAEGVYDTKLLRLTLWFSIFVSVVCSIKVMLVQGFSLAELYEDIVLVAAKYAVSRYASEVVYSAYGPLSLGFAYLAVLIAGLIFGSTSNSSRKKWVLLAFLPSIIIMVTQSAKGSFFGSIFYFLGGILVTSLQQNKLLLFKANILKIVFKIGSFSIILFIFSLMSRGLQDVKDVSVFFEKLRFLLASYFFAHLYNFSEWVTAFWDGFNNSKFDISHYYYGFYTFTSIYRFFGYKKETPDAVYDEYNNILEQMDSNVYTIFRGMVMDFGVLGTILFVFILGLLLHLCFYVFLNSKRPIISTTITIFMLVIFYYSFIISVLTWNIVPFVLILFIILLKFNSYSFVLKKTT
ncbi:O-antigen polymerase [Flavobacterium eburneipallidum]|uniref:O-antigen polymerase n=1 Tax=Flavobacterium eburneipallidum TaxID=3003263 RepID=UPI00248299C8|nr:O-antigen polymerase [Flavobacterium eburneipallidum]